MNRIGMKNLLSAVVDEAVWIDFVPEKKTIPAVTYTHLANGGIRKLKGSRAGLWDTWRVLAVGNNRTESDAILAKLKTLDNTDNADFKSVFILADGDIPAQPEDKEFRAFVDLKTYDR